MAFLAATANIPMGPISGTLPRALCPTPAMAYLPRRLLLMGFLLVVLGIAPFDPKATIHETGELGERRCGSVLLATTVLGMV